MLKYNLVQRKDLSKDANEGSKLWYPQLVSGGKLAFDDLCDQVAEECALTSADVKACMDRLVRCLARNLKDGRSVDCGDLGSFRINLRSEGVSAKEDYDASTMMRDPGVQFYLGKKLRNMRDTELKYVRITNSDDEEADPSEGME